MSSAFSLNFPIFGLWRFRRIPALRAASQCIQRNAYGSIPTGCGPKDSSLRFFRRKEVRNPGLAGKKWFTKRTERSISFRQMPVPYRGFGISLQGFMSGRAGGRGLLRRRVLRRRLLRICGQKAWILRVQMTEFTGIFGERRFFASLQRSRRMKGVRCFPLN